VVPGDSGTKTDTPSIEPGSEWHLDHRDDRRGTLGPAHALCNLQAAAAKSNAIQKARRDREMPVRIWSRVWFELIPEGVELTANAAREYYGRS
jgi:hypothetical protein